MNTLNTNNDNQLTAMDLLFVLVRIIPVFQGICPYVQHLVICASDALLAGLGVALVTRLRAAVGADVDP